MNDDPIDFANRPPGAKRSTPADLLSRIDSMRDGMGRGAETHDLARSIVLLHAEHRQCSGTMHRFPDECPLFAAWEARRPR